MASPGSGTAAATEIADEDLQRAEIYALLARLLMGPPAADLLARVGQLPGGTDGFGAAVGELAAAARAVQIAALKREYNDLFIGLSEGELQPYASHYLAGGLYRQPLAKLRDDLRRYGIERDDSVREPEDHVAILCEVMAALILGSLGEGPADLGEQRRFFDAHLATWTPQFFADLQGAPSADFYRPVGRVGALFMAIEREAFDL